MEGAGEKMKISIWISILVSALLAFGLSYLLEQPLHWYLFVILIFTGLLTNSIILVLKTDDTQKSTDTNFKGKA